MTAGEKKYTEYDLKVAERIKALETTVHETVVPLLKSIEENCRTRCTASLPSSATQDRVPSSTWFWAKVAGVVVTAFAGIMIALVNTSPQIIAAVRTKPPAASAPIVPQANP